MKRYIVRGSRLESKQSSYEYLADVFDAPSIFGHNLDALWDLLTELEDADIEVDEAREIVKNMGSYGLKLLDVFGDLQKTNNCRIHIYW